MSNMSYCRFANTNSDFSECCDVLAEMIDGVGDDNAPLSEDELVAAKRLAKQAVELVARLAERAGIEDINEFIEKDGLLDGVIDDIQNDAMMNDAELGDDNMTNPEANR